MKGTPNYPYYLALRWLGLLLGLGTCAAVLGSSWHTLAYGDVLFLGLLGAAAHLRPIVLRYSGGEQSTMMYYLGESLIVIALLRDGPAAALAVSLLSAVLAAPFQQMPLVKRPLEVLGGLFLPPAQFWLSGILYGALGGHRLLTIADCGLFFQRPPAMVAPLLLALFIPQDVLYRGYTALLIFCFRPALVRPYLCNLMLSAVTYVESVCGALALALWTVWGWSTLPFSLLITVTGLLSARNYLERVEARREAESDPLTGLASWRGLENFLGRQIANSRRKQRPFALLFLDVDGLKRVNDRHGHGAGDELLRLIGNCCREQTRKRDRAGRRGGDEFLLVLDGLDRTEAERVRARLQAAVTEMLTAHPVFAGAAGASIGLAMFPQDAEDKDVLIAMADRDMYRDKQARRAGRSEGARTPG